MREALWHRAGERKYPLVFLDNTPLGGYAALQAVRPLRRPLPRPLPCPSHAPRMPLPARRRSVWLAKRSIIIVPCPAPTMHSRTPTAPYRDTDGGRERHGIGIRVFLFSSLLR